MKSIFRVLDKVTPRYKPTTLQVSWWVVAIACVIAIAIIMLAMPAGN